MNQWKALLGASALLLIGATAFVTYRAPGASASVMTVYKAPTCGCCSKWVDHMRENGFTVEAIDVDDINAIKSQYGVANDNASCHTAIVDGYVIEGHVPADLVARLLDQRPEVTGLAVPGMPMGSPGMEGPYQDRYDIYAFTAGAGRSVFASR